MIGLMTDKKHNRADVARFCEEFFATALFLSDDPKVLPVMLELIENIKKMRTADMVEGTGEYWLRFLHDTFVEESTVTVAEQLRAGGWFDEGENT